MKNRALIALVTIVAAVFGGIALTSLKQELAPSVTFPQLAIVASYPGAAPEVVNDDVSTPIETAIQGVAGLESTSTTSSTNLGLISATFTYGTDLATAEQKINQAINRIKSTLPEGVEPEVLSGGLDDLPVIQISASASGEDTDALAESLNTTAVPDIEDIDGVREAALIGEVRQRITIVPDAIRLAESGLTRSDISSTLEQNGVLIPAGEVSDDDSTFAVQTGSKLGSVDDLAGLPLVSSTPAAPGSAVLTIGDVASVSLTDNPVTSISRVNGEPALTIAVTKLPAANTVDVSKGVRALLPDLEKALGSDVTLTIVFDQAPYIEQSIESLATEGLLGLVFAVLIILIFLLDVRATLVTAISIPTSVLITFIGLQATGYTLNILTLGALTIAIGRVVDDSIVVIENIKRHMASARDRSADGRAFSIVTAVREVAGAITASTITTVAVFLPLAFVGDMTGELFRPFALTVTIALVASLFVSLTIVPVLAYWFLRAKERKASVAKPDKPAKAPRASTASTTPAIEAPTPGPDEAAVTEPALVSSTASDADVTVVESSDSALPTGVSASPSIVDPSYIAQPKVLTNATPTTDSDTDVSAGTETNTAAQVTASVNEPAGSSDVHTERQPEPATGMSTVVATRRGRKAGVEGEDELDHPTRLQKGYLPIINWTLKHSVATLLLAVLVLGGTLALVPFMKTNFLGDSGQNTLNVSQQLPVGTSLDAQDAAASKVEDALRDIEGIDTVQVTIGSSGGSLLSAFGGGGGGEGSIRYSVTTDEDADQEALQDTVREELAKVDDAGEIELSAAGGFGASSDIEVDITAPDQDSLQEATDAVTNAAKDLDGMRQVSNNLSDSRPYVGVQVDRAAAAAAGYSEVALGGFVSQAMQPSTAGTIVIDETTLNIYIATENSPASIEELSALEVPTLLGPVALDSLATVEEVDGPSTITSVRGQRSATVAITPASDNIGTASAEVATMLDETNLPAGATATLGGVTADQGTAFQQLGLAMLAAILIVYIVMVATFRSLRQPLLLLVSVPFAATGAIVLQILTGVPLGVASLIGVLMLIGIVVTNAIVLVDLVNQYRARGMTVPEAVRHGSSRRLRPILMTALATIFALVPMALGLTGEGGFISQPLAIVVIGGLISSTLLTLIVLPTLYNLVEGARERRHGRREAKGSSHDVETASAL
ncbi:multidrug efflux pump subunit AcrB [Okibacterium sp. HSC-33S16]|uniref:efflux RND transporter permease subunit n=1 Tax=Okibacterium sp. HSC-33S16 TaxID=2910965 RepID=UPI00209CBBB2|nr:efflux RND transporter permease subunit [Okibacterium sp. HSC-33S16]MCP2031505.1 multidrug efflux pump subunit AcrB [Okibacterium sp. HSC-33S16]